MRTIDITVGAVAHFIRDRYASSIGGDENSGRFAVVIPPAIQISCATTRRRKGKGAGNKSKSARSEQPRCWRSEWIVSEKRSKICSHDLYFAVSTFAKQHLDRA